MTGIIRLQPEITDMEAAFYLNEQIDRRQLVTELQTEVEFLRSLLIRGPNGKRQIELHARDHYTRRKANAKAAWYVIENWPHLTLYAHGDPSRCWYKVIARIKGAAYKFDTSGGYQMTNKLANQIIADDGLVKVTPEQVIANWQRFKLDANREVEQVLVRLYGEEVADED